MCLLWGKRACSVENSSALGLEKLLVVICWVRKHRRKRSFWQNSEFSFGPVSFEGPLDFWVDMCSRPLNEQAKSSERDMWARDKIRAASEHRSYWKLLESSMRWSRERLEGMWNHRRPEFYREIFKWKRKEESHAEKTASQVQWEGRKPGALTNECSTTWYILGTDYWQPPLMWVLAGVRHYLCQID